MGVHCIVRSKKKMANHACANLVLDESKYSSPMPFIGLYIAAGSLLCFLAMVSDIFSGFLRKKRWLPCQLFTLNSVSLTLLGIAAKLPVDLTASMPSTLDQFSKLSGTAFICISMGFLMPSLGMNQMSEGKSNMIALSIMVVTVTVNICIQIRTGVILLFVTEHIIIMVCMLGLLLSLWGSLETVASQKNYWHDNNKDVLRKGGGSMLERLKLAYLYGFDNNPQFLLCGNSGICVVAGTCMVCSVVLIQAAFRNLSVDFCNGKSDYGWSMWVIVAVQVLTILVGCVAIVFRWVAMCLKIELDKATKSITAQADLEISCNPELRSSSERRTVVLMGVFLVVWTLFFFLPLYFTFMSMLESVRFIIDPCLNKYKDDDDDDDEDIKEWIHLVEEGMEEWVVRKGVQEMEKWIQTSKGYSPSHMLKLLSQTVPSEEVNSVYLQGLHVSTLSLALLARIAEVSLPAEDAAQSLLVQAYSESCEILDFIEERTKSKTFQFVYASEIAKALRRGNGYGYLLNEVAETNPMRRSLSILTMLKTHDKRKERGTQIPSLAGWHLDFEYWNEVVLLVNFLLTVRSYSSTRDLSKQIQQVFVDMFHSILAQLPRAIYNEINDSTAEHFDQSVRRALGVLCQVELLQLSVPWSYPVESDISQLWPGHSQESPEELEDSIPPLAIV